MRVAKTKALICAFVFAYADCWFSHVAGQQFVHFILLAKKMIKTSSHLAELKKEIIPLPRFKQHNNFDKSS